MKIGKPVDKELSDRLYNKVNMDIDRIMINETSFQIFKKVRDEIWDELLSKVDNQLHNQIHEQVMNQINNQIYNNL